MNKPIEDKPNEAEEKTKRGAAGAAHSTKGRARVIESKKIYNRNKQKEEDERDEI